MCRNCGASQVCEGKMALTLEPHNSVFPSASLPCQVCPNLFESPGWMQPADSSTGLGFGRAGPQEFGRMGLMDCSWWSSIGQAFKLKMGLTLESQNSVFPCASLAQPESPWNSLRALQESLYQGPIMVAPAEPSAGLEPDRANWSQEGGTTAYPQAKSIWKDVLNLAIMEPVGSV